MIYRNPMNKRKNVRNNLHCRIVLQGINQDGIPFEVTGRSVDISRTGCGIILDHDFTLQGSAVTISSAGKFRSEATVQWIRRDPKTGQVAVGLRLGKTQMNFAFKVAVSLLLSWAFLAQATFARPNSGPASGRMDSTRQEQTVSPSSALPGGAIAYQTERSWIQEAVLEASKPKADEGINSKIDISLTKTSYAVGETITLGTYNVSNPSRQEQNIELKTWITGPAGTAVSVGNVGSDGQYSIASGSSENYGPVQVLSVTDDMPSGRYEVGTRILNPVTGDILGENNKSFSVSTGGQALPRAKAAESTSVILDMQMSKSSYTFGEDVSLIDGCRIVNKAGQDATIEVKIWLEGPGLSPITLVSMGSDGSLILTPNANMKLNPMQDFKITQDLPAGTYQLKSRVLDPVTGQGITQTVSNFDIR